MTADKMSVDNITVSKITVHELTKDKITVHKMTVDKMSVDVMMCCRFKTMFFILKTMSISCLISYVSINAINGRPILSVCGERTNMAAIKLDLQCWRVTLHLYKL
jgi:hypothetical protein